MSHARKPTEPMILTMVSQSSVASAWAQMASSMGTTARSWAMSTPTVRRPVRVLSSPVFSNTLMATAVDDSATTNPSTRASGKGQPSTVESRSMTAVLAPIWKRVARTARRHSPRKIRKLSSMPTTNSNMRTPSSARTSICSRFSDQGEAVGAKHDTGHDVADDGGLAQALEPEAADQCHQGDGGDASEVCMGDGLHGPIVSRARPRRDGPHHRLS